MTPATTAKEAIVNELWPVLGGNHLDAEKWYEISKAVEAGLIATHPVGVAVADDPRVAALVEALEVSRKTLAKTNQRLAAHGYEENSATRKPVWLALKKVRTALAAFAPDREGK